MSPYSFGFVVKAMILMASGVYFLIRYGRKGPPFWISIILLTTGFFDMRFQMELWLQGRSVSDLTHWLVQSSINLMFIAANTIYHYFVLIFYLESSGYIKKYMYMLFLLPFLVVLFVRTELYPELQFDYLAAAILGSIYWFISFTLAMRGLIREHHREKKVFHLAIALILLSNGLILVIAHYQGKEFIELVNMTLFSIFLAICLLLLVWVNTKKMLVGMQRDAVVRKLDMGTALLNHSFKNAIGKVKINAWNIRNSLAKQKEISRQSAEEIDGYVQNLFLTYDHMMGMMSKISQMVRDKLIINPEQVDLAKLLDEALQSMNQLPDIHVVRKYERINAYLDRALTLECLINIIHNAADAMYGEGTMTVSAERKGRRVLISVTDTGVGMSKDQLSQVFEPFYSTKGRSGKNMGLGMYYVRKVAEAHKGKIAIQSELNEGTTVTLQFYQARKGTVWKSLKRYWLKMMWNGSKH